MKYISMIGFPKAKINLGLRITGKRVDGFHDIETVFYPVNLCDALELVVAEEPATKDIITITGMNIGVKTEENLIIKTIAVLREKYTVPVLKIHLHKAIPAGAGLGGGSSDAASTIKIINKCFGLSLDSELMRSIAAGLGSDCPFFIDSLPSYATGRGEVLRPVNPVLNGYRLLLVNPGIIISTRNAYNKCTPQLTETFLSDSVKSPVEEWKNIIFNDFENYIFSKYPIIARIKKALYDSGALYSSMSGSGSSVYGIFADKPEVTSEIRKYVIYNGLL